MILPKTGKDGLAERVMSEFSIVYTSATSQLQKSVSIVYLVC